MKWIILTVLLAGCQSAPIVLTKTQTVEVPVERIVAVPEALTADCVPEPLKDTTIASALERLSSVEDALLNCRAQIAAIRALKIGN